MNDGMISNYAVFKTFIYHLPLNSTQYDFIIIIYVLILKHPVSELSTLKHINFYYRLNSFWNSSAEGGFPFNSFGSCLVIIYCATSIGLNLPTATAQATEHATEQVNEILRFCIAPRSTTEIMQHLGLSHREHFRSQILLPLIASGTLVLTIPEKPSSPMQCYITAKSKD